MTRIASIGITAALLLAAFDAAYAADSPAACPSEHLLVTRSAGGTIEYTGSLPGIPELCRMIRTTDGVGDFYFAVWRADWPGAGQAYPAMHAVVFGGKGAAASFITRSEPGWQWRDTFTNEGVETMVVDGHSYQALKLAHERDGIEGNTYHSIITIWRDVGTGVALRIVEKQIAGQSYGPDTTWQALRVERLP